MLQPRRWDGPLIKAVGTSEHEGGGTEQRLHCGKSEPFKCSRRAEPEAKFPWGRSLWVGLLGRASPTSPLPLECPTTPHPHPLPLLPRSAKSDSAPLLQKESLSPKEHKKVWQHPLQETDPRSRKA